MARFGPEACRGAFKTMGLDVGMYYNSSGFKGVLVTVLVLRGVGIAEPTRAQAC